jgi:hypothetical protein
MLSFKKNYFYLPLLILLFGCSTYKDTNDNLTQNDAVTFYRTGNYEDDEGNKIACYWINEKRIDLTNPSLSKEAWSDEIIVQNDQIYTLGAYIDRNDNYITCYWVNKERTDLSFPKEYLVAGTLLLQDGQIYITGMYKDNEGKETACYWINGKKISLDTPPNAKNVQADMILVQDGHIYITGYYGDLFFHNVCYWVDGKRTDLGLGFIRCIYVKDDKIYVGGGSYDDKVVSSREEDDFSDPICDACYWVNGEMHKLKIPGREPKSAVHFIFIQNDNLHIICNRTSKESDYYNYTASYFVNDKRSDITGFNHSSAHSAFMGDDQIYIACYVANAYGGYLFGSEKLCYWVNGKKIKVDIPNNAEFPSINRIIVQNGQVYISGTYSQQRHDGSLFGGRTRTEYTKFYWISGKRTDFPSKENENAFDSYFVIQ